MMAKWYDMVYKPYISTTYGTTALLFDDFVCHKDTSLMPAMQNDGSLRILILPHYSVILQNAM